MDFSYSTPPFLRKKWKKWKKWLGKNEKDVKNGGLEYEKSMFPHGVKGITSYYHLVMHIDQVGSIISKVIYFYESPKPQHLTHFYEKKSSKSKKLHFFTRNMVYYGCACIVSCIIPICKCASPQIHSYHLKSLNFLKFWTFHTFFLEASHLINGA